MTSFDSLVTVPVSIVWVWVWVWMSVLMLFLCLFVVRRSSKESSSSSSSSSGRSDGHQSPPIRRPRGRSRRPVPIRKEVADSFLPPAFRRQGRRRRRRPEGAYNTVRILDRDDDRDESNNEIDNESNNESNNEKQVVVLGMDCEMVGAGYRGKDSLLGRCSIVRWKIDDDNTIDDNNIDKIETIYDVAVHPTAPVKDYRTAFSGLTRDSFACPSAELPVVSFDECRSHVSSLLASVDGIPNVRLVGHDLRHDMKALALDHPTELIRDTALYRPFSLQSGRRYLKRSLAELVQEELGETIQTSVRGHSSVEDATAALRLYLKHRTQWERSVRKEQQRPLRNRLKFPPGVRLWLDGCNLPLSWRDPSSLSLSQPQLLSKTTVRGTREIYAAYDWLPLLSSLGHTTTTLFFDGAKYRNCVPEKRPPPLRTVGGITIEVTAPHEEVDDVMVERCRRHPSIETAPLSLDEAVQHLSSTTSPWQWIVVRRRAGGSTKHKRLLQELRLRRPLEGGLCLTSCLNERLRRHSLHTAQRLHRECPRLVECTLVTVTPSLLSSSSSSSKEDTTTTIVVTDDVYLTDRLLALHTPVMVLHYKQMQQLAPLER